MLDGYGLVGGARISIDEDDGYTHADATLFVQDPTLASRTRDTDPLHQI